MKVTLQDGVSVCLPGAGHVGYFAAATPPEGYLVCSGAAISRAAYPELFEVIGTVFGVGDGSTTFNLPDLTGKFIRGTGGAAAALGVAQGDAIRNIEGAAKMDPFANHSACEIRDTTGVFSSATVIALNTMPNGTQKSKPATLIFNASTVVPTADENRPVNVALLPCIKY